MSEIKGDVTSFDANWSSRPETSYLHWTREEPQNQIQLAFRNHWLTFCQLIGDTHGKKRCLEVGCGRGSLSAYFADDGWDCTLLDLSPVAIERATAAFSEIGLNAKFDIGDCLNLPYSSSSFDLVFSIGLLEHFENINPVISEQIRILDKGGLFIGYVVPSMPDCIQKEFEWINDLLRSLLPEQTKDATAGKSEVYRSDVLSPRYLEAMAYFGLQDCQAKGIYPLPMVSHSPDFPFSLLPNEAEKSLVKTFRRWLDMSKSETKSDPWLCEEGYGQAFLVWGRK